MPKATLPTLDPDDLRAYAARDWAAPERLSRASRAAQSIRQRVALGIALYEGARATRPGWPTRADREADLANHMRLRAMLDKARDVGAR